MKPYLSALPAAGLLWGSSFVVVMLLLLSVSARSEPPPLAGSVLAGPRFTTNTTKHTVAPELVRGYDHFMLGNLVAARHEYLALLELDPKNVAALHGMAAISLRQGRPAAAAEYFQAVLESEPKNAQAQAGLIGLNGQTDAMRSESQLRTLLAAHREHPYVSFALGNLYAGQGRWNEAQQAYFNALLSEPGNPDTLFNLAVSLDRLHRPSIALEYYRLALARADERPFAFDKTGLIMRLQELR